MIGNTGNRPRTSTHHISHGAESPHPAATIHSSTAAARLAAGTADASPITSSAAPRRGRGGTRFDGARGSRRSASSLRRGASVFGAFRDEDVRVHLTLALDADEAAPFTDEPVFDQGEGCPADLDRPRQALRLHPARRVDDIAPEVVSELVGPDDPGTDRTGVDPDAEMDPSALKLLARDVIPHPQRQVGDSLGVVLPRDGHAGRDHVLVSNSLD